MDRSRHRLRDGTRRYARDETAEILDLAASLDTSSSERELGLTRHDLYRIADELGISEGAVDDAIIDRSRVLRSDARTTRKAVRRRMRFIRHAVAYSIVVGMLALVDALGGGGWWFFYVAAIWGIALALHAMRFVTRRNGPLERRFIEDRSVEAQ